MTYKLEINRGELNLNVKDTNRESVVSFSTWLLKIGEVRRY